MHTNKNAPQAEADEAIALIADYVCHFDVTSSEAFETAHACLVDSIGCAILALNYSACTKLLGPVVKDTVVPFGVPIPGTQFILDPIKAAFDIGTMIRWLDFNDTWLAAEWAHPSDNLGGILAVADYLSRKQSAEGKANTITMHDVFIAMIKAYEIQGSLAILNSFNRIGFDHVIFVKVATAAVVARLLGANYKQVIDAMSQAWIDVGPLRTYRHAPNTGSRKSWAAGDATSRGVLFAMMTRKGEMGYSRALTAPKWGLYDVLFQGKPFAFQRPLGTYVMENILFKVAFPAEFHAQTAVECALKLHNEVVNRINDITSIRILTHEAAIRIIDKKGPLKNPADRDHCLQYMVAIALLHGTLTADHYENAVALDPRIDALRDLMEVSENTQYSTDYLDPEKRSIASSLIIYFKDGSCTVPVAIEYPLGHKRRRQEGFPLVFQKCSDNLGTHFSQKKISEILSLFQDKKRLESLPVHIFMDTLI